MPVYISGIRLIVCVNGDTRKMLLTLINGGFQNYINFITELNPQFAVDSQDSRLLIDLEHSMGTMDVLETLDVINKILRAGNLPMLISSLKIINKNLTIETPRDIVTTCMKICSIVAQRDLLNNLQTLSEVIEKIGSVAAHIDPEWTPEDIRIKSQFNLN
jgi:hypothetical protein